MLYDFFLYNSAGANLPHGFHPERESVAGAYGAMLPTQDYGTAGGASATASATPTTTATATATNRKVRQFVTILILLNVLLYDCFFFTIP